MMAPDRHDDAVGGRRCALTELGAEVPERVLAAPVRIVDHERVSLDGHRRERIETG